MPPLDEKTINNIDVLDKVLSKFISDLSHLINSIPFESQGLTSQIAWALFIAFIGALSAYFFNFFHWKMVNKKSKHSNHYKIITSLIENLEEMAVDYWLKDFSTENEAEQEIAEIKIKSYIKIISSGIDKILPYIDCKKQRIVKNELEDFIPSIFDIATGGDFESKSRKRSKLNAIKISHLCTKTRQLLLSLEHDT